MNVSPDLDSGLQCETARERSRKGPMPFLGARCTLRTQGNGEPQPRTDSLSANNLKCDVKDTGAACHRKHRGLEF